MGDEMLQTLYTREILCSPKHVDEESFGSTDSEINNEFRVFRDYLGLINLIQPEGFNSSLDSPVIPMTTSQIYESMFDFTHLHKRNRLDSFDSDKGSEGSLGSRGEADLLLDSISVSDGFVSYRPSIIGEPLLSQVSRKQDSFMARKNKVRKVGGDHLKNGQRQVCVFCRNNGESKEFYSSHTLKDSEGNTSCPILRAYTCPLCKANGDNSHTIKYCPKYTPKSKDNKPGPMWKPCTKSIVGFKQHDLGKSRFVWEPLDVTEKRNAFPELGTTANRKSRKKLKGNKIFRSFESKRNNKTKTRFEQKQCRTTMSRRWLIASAAET